ncbi:MAG: hypothetical protein AAB217_22545 [Chloroflexota bacterium]
MNSKEGLPFLTIFLITVLVAALGLFFSLKARYRLISAIAPYMSALALAVLIGYTDQHNDEVWAALILMLPSVLVFGFLLPRQAWQWALIIGGSVFLAGLIGVAVGYAPPCHPGLDCPPPSFGNSLQALIAIIPAFVGAYVGAVLRWGMSYLHTQIVKE